MKIGRYDVKPLQDYMILSLVEEQQEQNRIALPQTYDKTKDESAIFRVEDVGPGWYEDGRFHESGVKTGDKVLVTNYYLAKVVIDREKVIVSRARDVALILNEEVKSDAGV